MRRAYKEVTVRASGEGYGIALDGKPMRTPAKLPLLLPSRALAEAIAAEWADQGQEVRPHAMPLMRLASTAIDVLARRRADAVAEIVAYAGTDLVCYRAERPPALVKRQQTIWQPLVDWATLRYDAPLVVTSGIVPIGQSPATLRAFASAVEAYDLLALAALHAATAACGSLVIALALLENRLSAAEAFAASQLDESFQIAQWGEDAEQAQRRAALAEEIAAAARFAALARR
ncbi:MAG: ATPase [Alphaproteobacteria bacterium]|nr:ATPase [Alphaproteobacteria bacterium]